MTGHARRMSPWVWVGASWLVGAAVGAVIIGRGVRTADRGGPHAANVDAWQRLARANADTLARLLQVDGEPDPFAVRTPGDDEGWAGGALLRLAQAPDETSARYWLAMYARRGATWEQQRDAWQQWLDQHDTTVRYLYTDRPEDNP